jgi:hypothetical protein
LRGIVHLPYPQIVIKVPGAIIHVIKNKKQNSFIFIAIWGLMSLKIILPQKYNYELVYERRMQNKLNPCWCQDA